MKALLLGSIGVLTDTSELQRRSYNRAFATHGVPVEWSRQEYRELLKKSGGRERVKRALEATGSDASASAIHATKTSLHHQMLRMTSSGCREGVAQTVRAACREGISVGFVTTTSRENVDAVLASVQANLPQDCFDIVLDLSSVSSPKPSPEVYQLAAAQLGVEPWECVAVEDNVDGVRSAVAAGMQCFAFPGENNAGHDFSIAVDVLTSLDLSKLKSPATELAT
ncbi:MAG: HAD-IA family hydrolase [Planctomycetota bacterium]